MMTVMLEKKTIICEEKKRMMIMMVTMSFGFITNSYKPSTSFLLVTSLGAVMVKEKNDDHDGDNEFWFHHQLL